MKRLSLIMILALAFALSGCSDKEEPKKAPESISRNEETKEPAKTDKDDADAKPDTQTPSVEEKTDKADEPVSDKTTPGKTLTEIKSIIMASIGASGAVEMDAEAMSSIYGFDTAHIAEAAGFVLMEGTFPHEVIMVKGKDASCASALESLLKVKLESFVEQSKGYDPENYALAQKCKVEKNGNYVALFLSPDCEQIKSVYEKYIK